MSAKQTPTTIKFKKKPTRAKLTKRTVEALKPPPLDDRGRPTQAWTYDTQTPRLAICCWSSGAKVWYWVGRGSDGRMVRRKLGKYPGVTPEQAKRLAGKDSAKVAEGVDRRREKWQARSEMTLAELHDAYLEQHARVHKRSWKYDQQQFDLYCTSIKARTLSSLSRNEFAQLHAKVGKEHGKYSANRLLAMLSKMYALADKELDAECGKPVKGIKKFREESRERFLAGHELQKFFASLEEETELFRDFFTLLLFTGVRRGNLQRMRFEHIDFDAAAWRIPGEQMKNGQAMTVTLTAEAVDILRRRQANSAGSPWVFAKRKNPDGYLKNPRCRWVRILERAGPENLRMHDIRRTLGSWQAATGASLPIIGKSLGHRSQVATAIYARLDLDPVRSAVNTAVAAMVAAAAIKPATDPAEGDGTYSKQRVGD